MDNFFAFMVNHPFLFGLMGLLIFMFFSIENKRSGRKISSNELGTLVNQQNAQIIDIRPTKQFEKGCIQGSRNIPFTELKTRLEEIKAIQSPIIIVCELGLQAGSVVQMIDKDDTCRLEGGINGWKSASMPLVNVKSSTNKKKKK